MALTEINCAVSPVPVVLGWSSFTGGFDLTGRGATVLSTGSVESGVVGVTGVVGLVVEVGVGADLGSALDGPGLAVGAGVAVDAAVTGGVVASDSASEEQPAASSRSAVPRAAVARLTPRIVRRYVSGAGRYGGW
jgi:hypothetical protein